MSCLQDPVPLFQGTTKHAAFDAHSDGTPRAALTAKSHSMVHLTCAGRVPRDAFLQCVAKNI